MRDEQILLDLASIAKWLDKLTKEINEIGIKVNGLIAEVPVSAEAWEKVGHTLWQDSDSVKFVKYKVY